MLWVKPQSTGWKVVTQHWRHLSFCGSNPWCHFSIWEETKFVVLSLSQYPNWVLRDQGLQLAKWFRNGTVRLKLQNGFGHGDCDGWVQRSNIGYCADFRLLLAETVGQYWCLGRTYHETSKMLYSTRHIAIYKNTKIMKSYPIPNCATKVNIFIFTLVLLYLLQLKKRFSHCLQKKKIKIYTYKKKLFSIEMQVLLVLIFFSKWRLVRHIFYM